VAGRAHEGEIAAFHSQQGSPDSGPCRPETTWGRPGVAVERLCPGAVPLYGFDVTFGVDQFEKIRTVGNVRRRAGETESIQPEPVFRVTGAGIVVEHGGVEKDVHIGANVEKRRSFRRAVSFT